jgi:hypothetical protein
MEVDVMDFRTIKRVRMEIETLGYFVLEVTDDFFKCVHFDDEVEILYYIYPSEDGYAVYTSKLQQL